MRRTHSSFFSIVRLLHLLIFAGIFNSGYTQISRIDSLLNVLPTIKDDTAKANTLREICDAYKTERNDIDKVGEYAEKLFTFSEKIKFKKGIAYGASFKGIYNWKKGNYEIALEHYKKSLLLMKELQNKRGESTCYLNIGQIYAEKGTYNEAIGYMLKGIRIKEDLKESKGMRIGYNNLGNVYSTMGNYTEGLKCYFKTLKIAEESKDRLGESYAYDNIGTIFMHQNKLDISIFYFKKAVAIQEEIGDKVNAGYTYNSIGNVYKIKNQYHEALAYHLRDLKIKEEANDKQGISIACNSVGYDYFLLNDFDKTLSYQLRSYELCKEIGYKKGVADASGGLGELYEQRKDYNKALYFFENMLNISKELDFKEGIRDSYSHQASVYTELKQFEKALLYTNLYNEVKDSLLNKENFKQVAELNTRYETDKKEKEILLLTKDQQLNAKIIHQQQLERWGLIGGLGLLSISIASIYRRYRFKQKANLILEKQKEEIEQKNTLITDSIDYAKTIQEAVLPDQGEIKSLLPESFVLYKPKAIVSGDFYWITRFNDQIICAVADCTGHGVPGAFMSLLGHNMLENVIKRSHVTNPAEILDELNHELISRLSRDQQEEMVKHGMDISLITINKNTGTLHFAGAHNSIYLVRNGELHEVKADKIGIGEAKYGKNHYTQQRMQLLKGDMIYLFTDGFPDQIGGPKRKKFFYQPFKELLTSISGLEPETQRNKLDESHVQWLDGKHEQTDDILIMGFRY